MFIHHEKSPKDRQSNVETIEFYNIVFFLLQANSWCARGIELLASQRIEKCSVSPEYAEESLKEIQQFVLSASEFCITASPSELRDVFQESATPETKALVSQVRPISKHVSPSNEQFCIFFREYFDIFFFFEF